MAVSLSHIEHAPAGDEAAPPVVIAHGLFGSGRNFNKLGRQLATDRRVILVDMRNHGTSPWHPAHDYHVMAEDLAEAIERLAGGPAVVLGHSMGGKAAMALALTDPGRVAGLITADIAPIPYAHSHEAYVQAMQAVDLSAVSRRGEADPMLADAIPEPELRAFILQNLTIEDGRARWRINLDAIADNMEALLDWPRALQAGRYGGPALFLRGERSGYMPPESHGEIRRLFPAARIEGVPEAGHWLHAERPEAFLDRVATWLGQGSEADPG